MAWLGHLGDWARRLKRDVVALWLAARDRRVPWHAKALAGAVAAYALSPIDLIPDLVPVLGYVDDLLIVPAGIWLAIRLIPAPVMAELRAEAAVRPDRLRSLSGLIAVLAIWTVLAIAVAWFAWQRLHR